MPIVRLTAIVCVGIATIIIFIIALSPNSQRDEERSTLPHLSQSEPVTVTSSEETLGVPTYTVETLCPQQHTETELYEGHSELIEEPPTPYGKSHYIGEVTGGDITAIDAGNTYHLPTPNQPLEANFVFYHRSAEDMPIDIRLVMLHNYQQIPMSDEMFHTDISAPSGENTRVKIAIPPLGEGVHDIVVLGWTPSGEEIGDDIFNTLQHNIYNRITIFVGNLKTRHTGEYYHLRPTIQSNTAVTEQGYIFMPHLQPVENDWEIMWWNYPEAYVPVENDLSFYLTAGYTRVNYLNEDPPPRKSITAALMAFIDGQQVKLAPNHPTYLALIDPNNSYTTIPFTLFEDELPFIGKQEMVFARINHPYMPSCWLYPHFNASVEMYRVGVDFGE